MVSLVCVFVANKSVFALSQSSNGNIKPLICWFQFVTNEWVQRITLFFQRSGVWWFHKQNLCKKPPEEKKIEKAF